MNTTLYIRPTDRWIDAGTDVRTDEGRLDGGTADGWTADGRQMGGQTADGWTDRQTDVDGRVDGHLHLSKIAVPDFKQ